MKVIAFYLPQFHEIPENNEWWGEGFTEWTNMRRAKPLFEGHEQPIIPENSNYYDLSNVEVMKWQAKLAKENGIYGFCIYHYWFDGKLLLHKPLENLLNNKNIDMNYCICWANEHWTNAWVSKSEKVLIEQRYGEEKDWEQHFQYLLPFFQDKRYISRNGKPLLVIYRPELIECLNDMLDYWNKRIKEFGIDGIEYAYQHVGFDLKENRDDSRFRYDIEYQPMYGITYSQSSYFRKIKSAIFRILNQFNITKINANMQASMYNKVRLIDYDKLWTFILKMKPISSKSVPGAFVRWDNTPRKGHGGMVTVNGSVEKFKKYFQEQVMRSRTVYKSDMLFLFAWNEWAEGGFLEPDEKNGLAYLKAIKEVIAKCGESNTEI
jgi:hypothetical protein